MKIRIISGKRGTRGKGEDRAKEEGTGREGEGRKGGNEGERGTARGGRKEVVDGDSSWSQEELIVKEEFIVQEAEQGNHVPTK